LENDNFNKKIVIKRLKEVYEIAVEIIKHEEQATESLSLVVEIKKQLDSFNQSIKEIHLNTIKRLDKLESTQTWAKVAAKEALPPSLSYIIPTPASTSKSSAPSSLILAGPTDTRREDRDIIVNVNKQGYTQDCDHYKPGYNYQLERTPEIHAKTREQENQALKNVA
ncbi:MAG: hypothetical protein LQ342_008576, partial [Letrouitia transgressa]